MERGWRFSAEINCVSKKQTAVALQTKKKSGSAAATCLYYGTQGSTIVRERLLMRSHGLTCSWAAGPALFRRAPFGSCKRKMW